MDRRKIKFQEPSTDTLDDDDPDDSSLWRTDQV